MIATRTIGSLTVAALVLVTPVTGRAQAPARDPIAAEALFERGKLLIEQGHTAEACSAFAESQRLDPAGGTLLRLALCHEAEGKLASAWVEFLEVVRVSKEGSGEPAKLQERVRLAREHLASIEPRVPRLVVSVVPAARVAGLQVTANGLPRNESTWGVALPVDPGDVAIVAEAPGRRTFRVTARLGEGQQQTVQVPEMTPEGPAAAPPGPPPEGATHASTGSALRPVGIVVGALGVVALGVGTYFGVHAISKWNDANRVCPGTTCVDPSGASLASDARQSARIADVTVAAGAAAVVAGVVLYVVGAPKNVQAGATGIVVRF
ncbi:MAG TPA: hypothetical protein VIF15_09845 [Polyangiaceae bacterium]|jgi:hypothetical protein